MKKATIGYSFDHCAIGFICKDGRFVPLITEESLVATEEKVEAVKDDELI